MSEPTPQVVLYLNRFAEASAATPGGDVIASPYPYESHQMTAGVTQTAAPVAQIATSKQLRAVAACIFTADGAPIRARFAAGSDLGTMTAVTDWLEFAPVHVARLEAPVSARVLGLELEAQAAPRSVRLALMAGGPILELPPRRPGDYAPLSMRAQYSNAVSAGGAFLGRTVDYTAREFSLSVDGVLRTSLATVHQPIAELLQGGAFIKLAPDQPGLWGWSESGQIDAKEQPGGRAGFTLAMRGY